MKKVTLIVMVALMMLTLMASFVSANPAGNATGNPYYEAPPQGQYWAQNGTPYCYGGGYGYQQGNGPYNNGQYNNGSYGGNSWNCW